MELSLTSDSISTLISHWKNRNTNHLYYLENMFREMLPSYATNKCELYATLLDSGNISLILEALNPGDHKLCRDALLQLANLVSNNQSFPVHPTFKIAASIFDSLARDALLGLQNRVLNSPEQIKNAIQGELGDKLSDVEDRVNELPIEEQPINNGQIMAHCNLFLLLLATINFIFV